MRVLRWGGLLPAAVAGVIMFATVSETGLLNGTHAPMPVTISAEQAARPVERTASPESPRNKYPRAPQAVPELPSGRSVEGIASNVGEMPPTGRMQ